jgi:hypothetical protein
VVRSAVWMQEQCEGVTDEIDELVAMLEALHSQLPFKINTPLAQQV